MKVTAKAQGYYGHLREVGEQFEIANESDLGDWMTTDEVKKGKKAAPMSHLAKSPAPVSSTDPISAKQAEVLKANEAPVASAPFKPAEALYIAKHNGGGNYIVVDMANNQIGDVYAKDAEDKAKAKTDAMAEADRLNRLGTMAEMKPTAGEEDEELQEEEDDHPDA